MSRDMWVWLECHVICRWGFTWEVVIGDVSAIEIGKVLEVLHGTLVTGAGGRGDTSGPRV